MIFSWTNATDIKNGIFIPKFYAPAVQAGLAQLQETHDVVLVSELIERGWISVATGDEIGKAAYGTGDIPFVRTSDIANWEIKTAPKQGVSKEIYSQFAKKQDVLAGDILFVRDGTYLIGNNCFITGVDREILYQSHVLKIRVNEPSKISPVLLFLLFNTPIVQEQVRSFQFTADIIDTIGKRFFEIALPVPKDLTKSQNWIDQAERALTERSRGKAFIKHAPKLLEACLASGTADELNKYLKLPDEEVADIAVSETISSELGEFTSFWQPSASIRDGVFLPKYYDVSIEAELRSLMQHCDLFSFNELRAIGAIEYGTGIEIGKMAYGTGTIPFLRTSDFANWEIHHTPKQGISEEIYRMFADKLDVAENDVLIVRDGTYLVGSSCIITAKDQKSLFSGGLIKVRVHTTDLLNPFLFLGLINSYAVKRQFRARQFTRDVIDTLGNRIDDVELPIPRSEDLRIAIGSAIEKVVSSRVANRALLSRLSKEVAPTQS